MRHSLSMLFLFICASVFAETAPLRDYPPAVKSVLEARCMTCHGCYDAPCQLKLDDWIGFERGGSKEKVYDAGRLRPAALTRLHEDALTVEQWRAAGFHPVVAERPPEAGLMYRMLTLKREHPQPTEGVLPEQFDFGLDRDQLCPRQDEFDDYVAERPLQGMPFGLPGLAPDEHDLLLRWLEDGAPGVDVPARPSAEREALAAWEAFLNGEDPKTQLMSRYIFEHLFIANLYFGDFEESGWYRLVRSRTPPGEPIEIIATRRPYDSPGVEPFYYRLQERRTTIVSKRHMPYALGSARMARWRALFLDRDYEVTALPGYGAVDDANPFITFESIPVESRYRFMLDEAHYTISAYIKGPVCRGQVALNVIDDHFWVAFVRPNVIDPEQSAAFLAREARHMRLPQAKRNLIGTLVQWRGYAKDQKRYLRAEAQATAAIVDAGRVALDLDAIWDGGPERNPDAALTIFRHFDSATVVRGHLGQKPKTMWIIDYSLLERIHYLLVAGFDVYGAAGHQLESRLYMDFLRMEGEQNFLNFLPRDQRVAVRNRWYRDAEDHVRKFLMSPDVAEFERDTAIEFESDDPVAELMDLLRAHIPAARNPSHEVANEALAALMEDAGTHYSFMPEVAFLQLFGPGNERAAYTLLKNTAHLNLARPFAERKALVPAEDTLTVAQGFVGTYPNMFFQVPSSRVPEFVDAIRTMRGPEDYTALVSEFGVRRTAPWFWKLNDYFVDTYAAESPVRAGIFDLNRYENR